MTTVRCEVKIHQVHGLMVLNTAAEQTVNSACYCGRDIFKLVEVQTTRAFEYESVTKCFRGSKQFQHRTPKQALAGF